VEDQELICRAPVSRGASQDIRAAGLDDLAAIEAVVAAAYGIYVPRMGRKPRPMLDDYGALIAQGLVYLFARDGVVDGVLVLIPEAGAMLLDNVAVRPAVGGAGSGGRCWGLRRRGRARRDMRRSGCIRTRRWWRISRCTGVSALWRPIGANSTGYAGGTFASSAPPSPRAIPPA
jgi:hypothetical protein